MYISIVTCQIAGTIIDDLDPMGLLETNGNEDGNIKGTSYLINLKVIIKFEKFIILIFKIIGIHVLL